MQLNFIVCMEVTCNETERNALLSFKHRLSDPSKRLSSWSDADDCCRWMGVRCNNITGRVMELDLSTPLDSPYMQLSDLQRNQLSGALPDSLDQLKHLEVLDLSNNTIVHSVPSTFSNLSSLRTLNIGHNQLNGTIPESLGFLRNLQVLNLGANSLTGGMSATLGILSNFVTLDLSSNCLEGPIQEKSLEKLFELKEPRLPSTNVFLNVESSWTPVFLT
ncbi:LRR receptor-like kinase [Medicago truncatula]|uniref:LRR receptor-like kinase n=1 Tax=Medicago truncatula TaxID=3880 RepID=A0A072TWV0_MEDTR|nr:LRR receptor-like kinase [Medicago truncatula]